MKKTLIAAAVLMLSSATFAQVTITGTVAYGYKASSTSANQGSTADQLKQGVTNAIVGGSGGNPTGNSSGFGIDTSLVTFSAKEDLGSGMSIAAEMAIDGLNRASIGGGDMSLKLTTGVGRLSLQTYKPADYLSGGISGVGGVGMDNKVFPSRGLKDAVGFDTKLGPIFVGFAHMEQASVSSSTTSGVGAGLGIGGEGAASTTGQRLTSLSATYVGGALIANLNYLVYDGRTDNVNTSYKDVIRTAASYNFGSFKVGGGVSVLTVTGGGTLTDSLVAVSVPVGAFTLGANFAQETFSGSVAQTIPVTGVGNVPFAAGRLDQTRSGYGLSVAYALTKRTSITATYADWLPAEGKNRNNEATMLLSHSF
ncbi:porin [Rhodoferax mekongensis]|uniref:Porin n=1 Tax=Rhodoferax mekongensis TaxID=3068341 RepID=A0ABZ0AYH1_9BURK|nr:porin [Rhodoferax sp. TBRC 17307]WNO04723.1 porin [Rhodoferax sp. TBRC 17307]